MNIVNISETEYAVTDIHVSNLQMQRYCVFDLEATGADYLEDYTTQFGAVLLEGSQLTDAVYTSLVGSPKRIPELIEKLTGIRNSDIEHEQPFVHRFKEFEQFCKNTILVTQAGYEFDWPLLQRECHSNQIPMLTNPVLDTKMLFTYLYPEIKERISTNFLLDFFEIKDNDLKRHDALGDSLLIARIFMKILKQFRERNLDEICITEPLKVMKMQLPPLSSRN